MNHTKEPWEAKADPSYYGIVSEICAMDKLVASLGGVCSPDEVEANARRIVACVNACEGITNEALEKGIVLSSVEKECWKWMHDNNLRYKDGSDRDFEWHGVKVWEEGYDRVLHME